VVGGSEPSQELDPPGSPARHVTLDDPSIDMTLPVGWREVTVQEWQEALANLPAGASINDQAFLSRLENGQVLTTAEGYTEQALSVELEVAMNREAATIEDAMSSIRDELTGVGEIEDVETGLLEAPIGAVVRVRYTIKFAGDPGTSLPAHLMAYAVPLGSDETIVIHSFGVQSDVSHQEMLDEMVSTLRPNDSLLPGTLNLPWTGFVEGTDLTYTYPDGFVPVPLDGLRASLAERIESGGGPFLAESRRLLDVIDGGILNAQLSSHRPLGTGRVLHILLHRHVNGVEDAIRRTQAFLGESKLLESQDVALPLGSATRVRLTVNGGQLPQFDDLYVIPIADGMTLTINGRAGRDDDAFGSTLRSFAESFEHG
jgi:hypothetical protein